MGEERLASAAAPASKAGLAKSGAASTRHEQLLRLVDYRGPGLGEAEFSPLVCDGDDTTEWRVKGLRRTAHGAPFGFVFEFADGAEHELLGVKLLSAGPIVGQGANAFEIRIDKEGDGAELSEIHHKGNQAAGKSPQSHVFERPVRVRRFFFHLLTNHGDPDSFQVNEVSPLFDTGSSSGPVAAASSSKAIPLAKPEPPNPDYLNVFPYNDLAQAKVPNVDDSSVKGPVDRFLLAALKAQGLTFSPEASREVLLRRVTYDLTGLPPTVAEIDAFLRDPEPDAYEKVVDRLLASPRFGERWAQHWLDLVLYADTDGYAVNTMRASAWRYRDYVIRAFNKDKPFDQFVVEQLAADEVDNPSLETLPALSFLRLGPFRINSGNQNLERNRQELLTSMTNAVGSTFLGMTVGCARCHDHKIDPILQTDYYRLQAYFASTEAAALPLADAQAVEERKRQSDELTDQLNDLDARRLAILKAARRRVLEQNLAAFPEETRVAVLTTPERRDSAQVALAMAVEGKVMPANKDVLARLQPEEKKELDTIESGRKELKKKFPEPLPDVWGIQDRNSVSPTYVYHRGDINQKKSRVDPRVPGALPHASESIPAEQESASEGSTTSRRLSLAHWLVGPGASRTARVMVNRLWQHHFGEGIVSTPNDFGNMGDPPSHPELLDWLARELIQGGWRLKPLHRQLVLSRAYRQTSKPNPKGTAADPSNRLLWRANPRRLSAEEIRDSLLSFSGQLNMEMAGPGVIPPLPKEVVKDLVRWSVTPGETQHNRRTIYLFVERNFRVPMLEAFDQTDTMTSCPKRISTTHALQSLSMLNNEWTVKQASTIARRVLALRADSERDRIDAAYRLITARPPTNQETKIAEQFLHQAEQGQLGAAWDDLCLVLVNLNRFLYID
jgi:hypothetical protein